MSPVWRRAFSARVSRERDTAISDEGNGPSLSPRWVKLGFWFGGSNPSSPTLHCRTGSVNNVEQTFIDESFPRPLLSSNSSSSSSRSPLSLLKNSFNLRSRCGICLKKVKSGHGTAIYTAECCHAFHFPCIAAHFKERNLVCPLCNSAWNDAPLLRNDDVVEEKKVLVEVSPRQQKLQSRSYDDDEPLFSLGAGGRFVPIPETDENDNVEEVQGCFVNPLRNVKVKLLPETAVISFGRSYTTYALLLRVKAPPLTTTMRAPIDLVMVVDIRESMSGAKLQMLKRAMRLVISSLGSADRLSIVASAKRLLPLKGMTSQGQRLATRIVDRLVIGQGVCVEEGLRKAGKVLEDRRERNPVATIILLSDGQDQDNSSAQRPGWRHVSSTRLDRVGIPIHTFGFGQNTHEPADDAFAKCVQGLLSVVVLDLQVQLGFQSDSAPAEIHAVYTCDSRPTILSSPCIQLRELYASEERDLLVELRVPTPYVGSHHVMCFRCIYKDPTSQEVMCGRDEAVTIPRLQANEWSTPKTERLRNLFITTRAITEGRRLIDRNDFESAYRLLASLRDSVSSAGECVRAVDTELEELRWRKQHYQRQRGNEGFVNDNGDPLTPNSAWRTANNLAKLAIMKKSLSRVGHLYGFENARF